MGFCVPSHLIPLLQQFHGPFSPPLRYPDPLSSYLMLHALERDSFLIPCTSEGPPNCNVYLRPKSSTKAAFIADLRAVNALCPDPIPPFHLPTPTDVASCISSFPPATLWGCTIDITNFFWSLKLPLHAQHAFRIAHLSWPCLPFGWNRSPVIAQLTLARLIKTTFTVEPLSIAYGRDLLSFHYYDDILLLATSPHLLAQACDALLATLKLSNLVLSPKSTTVPAQQLVWLGKSFNLVSRSVSNRPSTLLHGLALTVLATSSPCHHKLIDRITGYMLWLFRPHSAFTLYMYA